MMQIKESGSFYVSPYICFDSKENNNHKCKCDENDDKTTSKDCLFCCKKLTKEIKDNVLIF